MLEATSLNPEGHRRTEFAVAAVYCTSLLSESLLFARPQCEKCHFKSWKDKVPRSQSVKTHRRDHYDFFKKTQRKGATGGDQH